MRRFRGCALFEAEPSSKRCAHANGASKTRPTRQRFLTGYSTFLGGVVVHGLLLWGMPNYRRVWMPGGTYFFTVNLLERQHTLLVEHVAALRDAFGAARVARPFEMIAIVVLPDHLHCVWRLPAEDADNATRWRHIKTLFVQQLPRSERRSAARIRRKERGIWQRRYWERLLRDERDLRVHVDYVHFNPVKHGYVAAVNEWPWSSFHRYVRVGILSADWGGPA
jgi:putative transposase